MVAEVVAGGAAMIAAGIVSVGTATTAAAEAAVGKAAMIVAGQMKQTLVTLTPTDRLKVANNQVSNDIIYKYWEDYG